MNYTIWDQRKFLGMIVEVKPRRNYWLDLMFGFEITSENEYIDFEKIPALNRVAAPYVMPLAAGRPVMELASRAGRFKPAYVKVKDSIDPLQGLVKIAGSGEALFNPASLSIQERRELMRIVMNQQHVESIQTRHELQAAQAVIDAGYIVEGEDYPAVTLNFGRAASHTVVKTAGNFWGDSGVSIMDDIQIYVDRMVDAPFGGLPSRMTMGPAVWSRVRKDPEILKHMDVNVRGGAATIERGIIGTTDKSYKVGELNLGGNSGNSIEMWVSKETYQPERGSPEVPFLPVNKVTFTGSKEAFQGYRCFGTIIDPKHSYASAPIVGRGWEEIGDPATEYMLHQSAPLHLGLNPNTTLTVTAAPAP